MKREVGNAWFLKICLTLELAKDHLGHQENQFTTMTSKESLEAQHGIAIKPSNREFPGLTAKDEGAYWTGPFYFIQAADPQFGLIDGWNGVPENEITWGQEIVLTNKAMECINKLRPAPKFVSICGDLVDAAPGTEKHELQIADLLKCLQKLDSNIPLTCLPGNHDIGNTPTVESIKNYERDFGDDYYTFFSGGKICFIFNCRRSVV